MSDNNAWPNIEQLSEVWARCEGSEAEWWQALVVGFAVEFAKISEPLLARARSDGPESVWMFVINAIGDRARWLAGVEFQHHVEPETDRQRGAIDAHNQLVRERLRAAEVVVLDELQMFHRRRCADFSDEIPPETKTMATKAPPVPKSARRSTTAPIADVSVLETDDQLLRKLFDAEGDCWAEFRTGGLSDEDLGRELAVNRFVSVPTASVQTARQAVSVSSPPSKSDPFGLRVWLDILVPQGKSFLQGKPLVDRMRSLLGIPGVVSNIGETDTPLGKTKKPIGETKTFTDETSPADEVSINLIGPKNNPRKHFDKAKLEELAESIRRHGVLQPLLLRPAIDGKHELVAGERRLRAAKMAGLKTVPVRIVDKTDLETAAARMEENLNREDLNPIEEALGYQDLLDRFPDLKQKDLAKQFSRDESHISNRMRLLKLPHDWQQLVAAKEITDHHAWAIVPWADRPVVLTEILKEVKDNYDGKFPDAETFKDDVYHCVRHRSRPLNHSYYYDGKKNWGSIKIDPKHKRIAELDTFELKSGSHKETRCWNIEVWESIVTDQQRKRSEGEASRTESGTSKMSPAESKKKQAETYAKKLWRYTVAWHQAALLRVLDDDQRCPTVEAVVLWLLHLGSQQENADREAGFCKAIGSRKGSGMTAAVQGVEKSSRPFEAIVIETAKAWLSHSFEGWRCDCPPATIIEFAKAAGVDVAKEWILDEEFLQLHTTDQLQQLAKEWKLNVPNPAMRKFLVSRILEIGKAVKTPERLIKPKDVRLV